LLLDSDYSVESRTCGSGTYAYTGVFDGVLMPCRFSRSGGASLLLRSLRRDRGGVERIGFSRPPPLDPC
jgi:hypothetical protein